MAFTPELTNAYVPIDVDRETPIITKRLQTPDTSVVQPTDLEVSTTLQFMNALARVKKYIPLFAERALKETYAEYQESVIPPQLLLNSMLKSLD